MSVESEYTLSMFFMRNSFVDKRASCSVILRSFGYKSNTLYQKIVPLPCAKFCDCRSVFKLFYVGAIQQCEPWCGITYPAWGELDADCQGVYLQVDLWISDTRWIVVVWKRKKKDINFKEAVFDKDSSDRYFHTKYFLVI